CGRARGRVPLNLRPGARPGLLPVAGHGDDHLLLDVVDDFIFQQAPTAFPEYLQKEAMNAVLAKIAATTSDFDPRTVGCKQIRDLAEHAVIEKVPVGELQRSNLVLVLQDAERVLEFCDVRA